MRFPYPTYTGNTRRTTTAGQVDDTSIWGRTRPEEQPKWQPASKNWNAPVPPTSETPVPDYGRKAPRGPPAQQCNGQCTNCVHQHHWMLPPSTTMPPMMNYP